MPQCWRNFPSPSSEYPQLGYYVPEYKSIINGVFGIWKVRHHMALLVVN